MQSEKRKQIKQNQVNQSKKIINFLEIIVEQGCPL
jgi:hypothetical protein